MEEIFEIEMETNKGFPVIAHVLVRRAPPEAGAGQLEFEHVKVTGRHSSVAFEKDPLTKENWAFAEDVAEEIYKRSPDADA